MKNIHGQIPESIQLYYLGTDPYSDVTASSLIKELEGSSLKPPTVDYAKSSSGKTLCTCIEILCTCIEIVSSIYSTYGKDIKKVIFSIIFY